MEITITVRNDENDKSPGTIFCVKDEKGQEWSFKELNATLFCRVTTKVSIWKENARSFFPAGALNHYSQWFNYFFEVNLPCEKFLYPSSLERGDRLYIRTDDFISYSNFLEKIPNRECGIFSKESGVSAIDLHRKEYVRGFMNRSETSFYGPTNP